MFQSANGGALPNGVLTSQQIGQFKSYPISINHLSSLTAAAVSRNSTPATAVDAMMVNNAKLTGASLA